MTKKKATLPSLKAMAEAKQDGINKATIFIVDPDVVEFEEGFNLREEGSDLHAHLEALYAAMKAGANVPPIDVSVVDGRVFVRDGHCRTRVARRLKTEGVPYQLQARQFRGNDAECVFHMISSAQGKALTPLEQGRGFLRLIRYNLTVADIVRRTGLNRTTIENGLTLAEAPVEMQQMIISGQVSCQVALDTLKKHGAKATEHLAGVVKTVQATGAKKVTRKHVSGPKVTPSIVQSFVTTTTALREAIEDKLAEVEREFGIDDTTKILVPAKLVRDLLAAQRKIGKKEEEETL